MTFLPVALREMSVASRRKGTYWWRVGTAFLGVLMMAWLFFVSAAGLPLGSQGKMLFTFLAGTTFIFSLLIGVVFTSDSLSEEKREGTLGLLFLTDLKGYDVALGKLAASSLTAAFAVLGIVPMIALTLLLGGISLEQIGLIALLILNTLFLSLSGGILISAISKNERRAMFSTLFLIFAVACFPYFLSAYAYGVEHPSFSNNQFLFPSPIYTYWLTLQSWPITVITPLFMKGLLTQHVSAWIFLILASILLPRVAHPQPVGRHLEKFRAFADRWSFGSGEKRRQYRASLLDKNAFSWLAAREKVKGKYVWGVFAFFTLFWLWIWWQFPLMAFDLPVMATILFLVHLILKIWISSEVASRMIEDKRSGALELLLSTPLSVKQIAAGQNLALWQIFGWPIITLILLEFFLMHTAVRSWGSSQTDNEVQRTFIIGMGALLVDCWAIKWVAMWRSLFSRSIERIMAATIFRILLVPWIVFGLFVALWIFIQWGFRGMNRPFLGYYLWAASTLLCALFFALPARFNLLRHFREVASQSFDARQEKPGGWSMLLDTLWLYLRPKSRDLNNPPSLLRRHWVAASLAAVFLVALLLGQARQFYWRSQVSTKLAHLQAAGIPVNFPELAKSYPAPPAQENAATLIQLRPPSPVHAAELENLTHRQTMPAQLSNRLRAIRERNRGSLKQFANLTNHQTFWVDLSSSQITWWAASLSTLHVWIPLLYSESFLYIEDAKIDEALQHIELLLHLARLLNDQPITQSRYLRDQAIRYAGSAIQRLLSHTLITREQIEKLQVLTAKADNPHGLVYALRGDRVAGLSLLKFDLAGSKRPMGGGPPSGAEQFLLSAASGIASRFGELDRITYKFLEYMDAIEAHASLPYPQRGTIPANFESTQIGHPWFTWNLVQQITSPQWIIRVDMQGQARLNLLRSALALEQFYLTHQKFPKNLQEGGLLDNPCSRDPFDGLDLKYSLLPHGYILYSSGPDGDNDLGIGNFTSSAGFQDIVFSRIISLPENSEVIK